MWVGMLVMNIWIVFVAMNHRLMAMPVRVFGRSGQAVDMTVLVMLVMVMFMAVL